MKIGYTLETSIADIIDNSIAAKAKKIEIEIPYSTENGEPFISIKDGKKTKIGYKIEKNKKIRYEKKTGEIIQNG